MMRYLGSYRIRNMQLVPRGVAEFGKTPERHSQYYVFREEDWRIMRYALEQLISDAKGKKLVVFTIPVYSDFQRYTGSEPPLSRKLRELAEAQDFVYVDLLQEIVKRGTDYRKLFFVCDPHWNAAGNAEAADILLPHVREALSRNGSGQTAETAFPVPVREMTFTASCTACRGAEEDILRAALPN